MFLGADICANKFPVHWNDPSVAELLNSAKQGPSGAPTGGIEPYLSRCFEEIITVLNIDATSSVYDSRFRFRNICLYKQIPRPLKKTWLGQAPKYCQQVLFGTLYRWPTAMSTGMFGTKFHCFYTQHALD